MIFQMLLCGERHGKFCIQWRTNYPPTKVFKRWIVCTAGRHSSLADLGHGFTFMFIIFLIY
jgi:hypothetical protein